MEKFSIKSLLKPAFLRQVAKHMLGRLVKRKGRYWFCGVIIDFRPDGYLFHYLIRWKVLTPIPGLIFGAKRLDPAFRDALRNSDVERSPQPKQPIYLVDRRRLVKLARTGKPPLTAQDLKDLLTPLWVERQGRYFVSQLWLDLALQGLLSDRGIVTRVQTDTDLNRRLKEKARIMGTAAYGAVLEVDTKRLENLTKGGAGG